MSKIERKGDPESCQETDTEDMSFMTPPDTASRSPVDSKGNVGIDSTEQDQEPHKEKVTDKKHHGDCQEEEP